MNASTKIVLSFFSLFLVVSVFFSTNSAQAQTCALTVGKAYKTSNNRAVYYISSDCKKRPIKNPATFFSYFDSWEDVQIISQNQLQSVVNHELGFLPWGPKRTFEQGSVIKTTDDNRVYVLLGNQLHSFASEESFLGNGYKWGWVEDVSSEVISKYAKVGEIKDSNEQPKLTVLKYENSPEVYVIKEDNSGKQYQEYVKSLEDLKTLEYRADRIVTLPKSKAPTQRFYADPDNDGYGTSGNYIIADQYDNPPAGYIRWITGRDNDNCPNISNSDQKDSDGDGIGDACDTTGSSTPIPTERLYADPDNDGYGTPNDYIVVNQNTTPPSGYIRWITGRDNDNCPNVYNPDQKDSNGNGKGDACESSQITQRFYADPDGDGYGTPGDYIIADQYDSPPAGYIQWITGKDNDNCPNAANVDQKDSDGDGIGDVCDTTNTTTTAPTQRFYADPDNDGYGTAGDYIVADGNSNPPAEYIRWITGRDIDNCSTVYNPDQKDNNGNSVGDACEPGVPTQRFYADPDGDGYGTSGDYILADQYSSPPDGYIQWITGKDSDNCPNVSNQDQKDSNGNGKGDACEI